MKEKQEYRYSRQSFLGFNSQRLISQAVIGIVGAGGGGSHAIQQAAHIGFQKFVIYDPQRVEYTNLTRLVGATERDVKEGVWKADVSIRTIRGLQPKAEIATFREKWQNNPKPLRNCDLVIGGVDGFSERKELETLTRGYLIPLIDMGLAVHKISDQPPRMGGQVMLSMPGNPCMFCLGLLTQDKLALEGQRYGDAGPNPQVVWANGILASTAVGLAVDLITDWTGSLRRGIYLEYDANQGTMSVPLRMRYLKDKPCKHYQCTDVGDVEI